MLRSVYLHGKLGKKYGKVYRFAVATAADAVRALNANFPGILKDLKVGEWRVVRGDKEKGLHLDIDDVTTFKLGSGDLHLIPVTKGSKRRGLVKTVLGVALAGVAVVASGGALAAPILGGLMTGGNLAMMGVALAIGGAASLLAPKEHPQSSQSAKADVALGPQNTYEQGNPVPLIYGEVICGSQVISSGLTLAPFSASPATPAVNTFTVGSGASALGSNVTQGYI